jgi:zinc transport system substrate-binding protein
MEASKGDVWFQIGEGFEAISTPALKSSNPKLEIVDLQKGLDLIRPVDGHSCCPHHHDADPHFWMSPRLMNKQSGKIAQVLINHYPENKELYEKNLAQLQANLTALDADLSQTLGKMPQKVIMVSHPSYSYLARDYGFQLLSLESEGRDPTPLQVTKIIEEAKKKKIKVIYIQEELNTKGAKLVADIIGAKVVTLDPYRKDFADNLREIATHFAHED